MQKYLIKTDNSKKSKRAFKLLSSIEVDVVSFTPRLRRFNKIVKENIRFLVANKKRRDMSYMLYNERIISENLFNRHRIQNLFSDNKIHPEYNSFLKTYLYGGGDINEIIQLKNNRLRVLLKHIDLTKQALYFSLVKKKEFNLKEFAENVYRIDKSEHEYILGYIEEHELPLQFLSYSTEYIAEFIKRKISEEGEKIETIDSGHLAFKTYRIKHINNSFQLINVGKEMHHCVGGYRSSLKTMKQLFFDVYDKDNKRYTLSVRRSVKNNIIRLSIGQYLMHSNKSPKKGVRSDMLKFINQLENDLNT